MDRLTMSMLPTRYVTVEEECKRNPELKMSDLQMLMDWLHKQPHLPRFNKIYLVHFLHSNYYNLEAAKRTMENYYTIRTHFPEVFSNRDPIGWKELRKAFTVTAMIPLEQKTQDNCLMLLVKFLDIDPNRFNVYEFTKYMLMTSELLHMANGTSGEHIVIFDALGWSFNHVVILSNVMYLKKFSFYFQEALPLRLKAIHILNTTPIIQIILNIAKPFLKVEILNKLHFHSNLETVKKFLPIEALPNECGGQAGPLEKLAAKNIKLLEENREYFQEEERLGRVNESLRIDKLPNEEGLFGVEGSFKKIEID